MKNEVLSTLNSQSSNKVDVLQGQSINSAASRNGVASEFLIPLFLKIFDLKEDQLSKSISICIVELDDLAISIDSQIDSDNFQNTSNLSVGKFTGLETKVVDCFSSLTGISNLDKLVADTLYYVNMSFKYNTTERHLVYSFDRGKPNDRCTTLYLYPLIEYLSLRNKIFANVKPLFTLIANYIQLLDDFIDVFKDIDTGIATSVTERFLTIKSASPKKMPFSVLVEDVQQRLCGYVQEIRTEINTIRNREIDQSLLNDWCRFHDEFAKLAIPEHDSVSDQIEYLRKVHHLTPPVICYTS